MNWRLVGLTLSLALPSLGVVQKYTGLTGVGIYLVAVPLALWLLQSARARSYKQKITRTQARWLLGLTFALLVVLFRVGYPLANSGALGGGSDRDDALDMATRALFAGRYPYSEQTYLGNPISPLPGALLFAAPFVLLGGSASQNLFWMLVFVLALAGYLKDLRQALLLLWVVLALSPVVLQEFISGGDLLANSIVVTAGVLGLAYLAPAVRVPAWQKYGLAILLGVGLSWRANFLLVLPLLFSSLASRAGKKQAAIYLGLICLTFVCVSLPLYLVDPGRFTPLSTLNELGRFAGVLPFAGMVVPALTLLLAMALSVWRNNADISQLMRNCALVLALPVVSLVALHSLATNQLNLSLSAFGMAFLFFGVVGNNWMGETDFSLQDKSR